MNKQANILFIPTSIGGYSAEPQDALSQHGYYQQLIYASLARSRYTVEGFQVLGRQLGAIARHAYLARQMDEVEQAAQLMLALPISDQLKSVAQFYQALCIWQQGDIDNARQSLERVVEEAMPQFSARALQVIGLTYQKRGELDAAVPYYLAAGNAAASCDLLTVVESQKMTAVVRSIHGDHKQALADLERLFPLVRAIGKHYPATYYDFLNSLAVELGEVGRVTDAESALSIALASPFASAYPEWGETRDEIAAKRDSATPSIVAINRAPEAESPRQAEPQRQPEPSKARALSHLASKRDSFQVSVIRTAATTALNCNEIPLVILYCLRKCVRTRGPPALSQGTFRSRSKSIVELADEKARAGQNRFAVQFFCAQSYRLIVAISICVSLCCRNYISRAPPLRRDGESDAGSLNRLASTSNVRSFKAYGDQHLQPGLVDRREVNPQSQLGRFERIWAGRRVCDSLPTLTAQSVWRNCQ